MQDEVGEEGMFNEVVQTLSGMGRLEKLVLGIVPDENEDVSLRWHSIVVMNYRCLVQGM